MNFPAKIFINLSSQNNYSSIFDYRGQSFRFNITHSSLSSSKFTVIVEFLSPIQSQYLDFLCKIVSSKTIQARHSQLINESEKKVIIQYNISYDFLISNKIIEPGEVNLTLTISPGQEIRVRKKIIKPAPNQCTLDRFLGIINNYEKPTSINDNPYAGIANQGATCYLNSILQLFFHLPVIRGIILTTRPVGPIPTAIQKLFFRMQFVDKVVTTKELTAAFGWTKKDIYKMRDAEETFVKMLDHMRKWVPHLTHFFQGSTRNGRQSDTFVDLHFVVESVDSLETSLALMLADGTRFERNPPILVCHLRRTSFDPLTGRNRKINSEFTYPLLLNLCDDQYTLAQVIVHSGTTEHGHYTIYVKPSPENQWFFCNDSRVKAVETGEVLRFTGGFSQTNGREKWTNAYILTYVRIDMIPEIYKPIDEARINQSLFAELDKKEDIKQFEQYFYLISDDGLKMNAVESSPGLLNLRARRHLFCDKAVSMWNVYERISELYNLEMGSFRVWTVSPQVYLSRQIPPAADRSVEALVKQERTLFVEPMRPGIRAHDVPDGAIVVFVHVFLPYEPAPIQYVGAFEVFQKTTPLQMTEDVCCAVGIPIQPLRLYVLGAHPLDLNLSFEAQGVRSGELLCFEGERPIVGAQMEVIHPGASSITRVFVNDLMTLEEYLAELLNRVIVNYNGARYSYSGGVSLEDCARAIVETQPSEGEDVIVFEGDKRVVAFEAGTRHEVSILKVPKGCVAPLVDVSDDAVTVRESRRIPLQPTTTADELITCAAGLGMFLDGRVMRLLKIDGLFVTRVFGAADCIGECDRLRIEAVPLHQLDTPLSTLFCVSRVRPRRDGGFEYGGPPFLVEFGGGRAEGLLYAVAKALGTAEGLSLFRLRGETAERLAADSLVPAADSVGVACGC